MAFKVLTLLDTGSVAATQTGTVAASGTLATGGTKPVTGSQEGCVNQLSVGVNLTVTSGNGTVDVSIQGKYGDNWVTLTPNTAFTSAVTLTDGSGHRTFLGPVPVEIRGVATLTGTATFDATIVAIGMDNT